MLVFACNWDGWSCIETVTEQGLNYPASVKILRVSCLSRVHTGLILKAFEFGADGVMLLGCEPGRCHFGTDREHIVREYEKTSTILEMLGIRKERLVLVLQPAFDGPGFVRQVTALMTRIASLPIHRGGRVAVPGSVLDIEVQSLI